MPDSGRSGSGSDDIDVDDLDGTSCSINENVPGPGGRGGGGGGRGFGSSFGPGLVRESREITLKNARRKIEALAHQLSLRRDRIDMAFHFFKLGWYFISNFQVP